MTESTCIWKGCKETIELDTSFEDSAPGQKLGISVAGWCEFHSKVYAKQTELFDKLSKDKHHSDISNDLYKNNRKKYNKIQKQAIALVKKEMEKLQVPIKQPDGSFSNGPIGGFTFPSGEKALIYQCGICGDLCKFNTGYNKHRRLAHNIQDGEAFGWADGEPNWQELDIIQEMIVNV